MKTQSSNPNPSRNQSAKEWSRQNDEQRATRAASQDSAVQRTEGQRTGQHRDESGQSGRERSEQRVQRPGEAGLANEARPGLGSRAETHDHVASGKKIDPAAIKRAASDQGQTTQRPEPREQRSDSYDQEQQRSTGVSGLSSGA